jgi:glycosyltransferase involved in cell wall biosynthesis
MQTPIWLIASGFEPRASTLYTLRLAGRLPELGYEPRIVCSSASQIPTRLRTALDIIEVPYLHNRFWRYWNLKQFIERFAEEPPELLHAQRRVHLPATLELSEAFDRPCVATVHEVVQPGQRIVNPARLKAVLATNRSVERDLAVRLGVPANVVHYTPAGVEIPTDLPTIAESNNGKPRLPVVGMASVLDPAKGAMYFLMAADLVLSSGQDVEFLIAGTGPDEQTLRRAARKLDIAHRMTFVGHTFDYRELLSAVDLFVSPSLEEGLSVIVLEAMAIGLPVISTKVGGMSEVFRDNEQIFFVPPANHSMLAEKIQTLLDNPAKAKRVAAAGKEFIRREFSVDRMVKDVAAVYERVLAGDRSAAVTS